MAAESSQTFEYTGEEQVFVVPAGITHITVDAYGAEGAAYDESSCESGGYGGRATAVVAVTPGEPLQVFVGGRGSRYDGTFPNSTLGGFNGGGNGLPDTVAGSRGSGGASDVRRAPYQPGNRLVVAGGGGGAGNLAGNASGGAGGAPAGEAGATAHGGEGGSQTAGGAAGATDAPVGVAATAGDLCASRWRAPTCSPT